MNTFRPIRPHFSCHPVSSSALTHYFDALSQCQSALHCMMRLKKERRQFYDDIQSQLSDVSDTCSTPSYISSSAASSTSTQTMIDDDDSFSVDIHIHEIHPTDDLVI